MKNKKNKKKVNKMTRPTYDGPAISVNVHQNLPTKCFHCGTVLSSSVFPINYKNMNNPQIKTCNECNAKYITMKSFRRFHEFFSAINEEEVMTIINERDAERAKKIAEAEEQRKAAVLLRTKMSSLIETKSKELAINHNFAKNVFNGISDKEIKNIVAAFVIKKDNHQVAWYFISTREHKSNHPSSNVSVVGFDTIMGKSILESHAGKDTRFKFFGEIYSVIGHIVFNESKYNEVLKKIGITEIASYPEKTIKSVYVYFRLNNKCLNENHDIISVTTKTLNIVNGSSVEVNVFYCRQCDKYFINYEALANYFDRGIHPAFKYYFDDKEILSLKEMSELRLYGYNVKAGELTESERHILLANIIDMGLLSKAKIIKDLQFKVNYNGKKFGNEKAKLKWQKDIDFVSHYVKGNAIRIESKFIR